MKKTFRLTNLSFLFLLLAAAITGCVKKDDYYKENTDEPNRKQVVQIYGAQDGTILYARDANPPLDTFVLIDLRRYPNKEADLSTPLTVKVQLKLSLINDYNTANGTSLVQLPFAAFSLSDDINTVTFGPGEGQKQVKIRLDKNQLDLSKQYALGFALVDAGTGSVINTAQKEVLYIIGVKNQWDGIYQLTGDFTHPTACFVGTFGTDADTGPLEIALVTVNGNQVKRDFQGIENAFCYDHCNDALQAFSAVPRYQINSNNTVTIIPGPSNGVAFDSYSMTYDLGTRTFNLHYGWSGGTRFLNEKMVYLRPR